MKVLMVCHNYPPAHAAGTEIYTAELARQLAARGHAVSVFATTKDVARKDLSLCEREHAGVAVTELVNNLFHDDFRGTWDHPRIAALFGAHLDRARPDVVHFQHLLYLSIGCVEEAARRGLGVVFTLHDFWLQCPRFGQRVHADGTLCARIEFDRCGTCMASFKFAQSPLERAAGRALAGLREATGLDLGTFARGAARAFSGAPESAPAAPDPALAARRAEDVRERDRAVRERVVPLVQRFLSPSRFLREQFIAWGVPADKIEHLPTGLDPRVFTRARSARTPGGEPSGRPLRVGFVGSLVPLKGPALLLAAWGQLEAELRRGARLELHGPGAHHPAFQAELARLAAAVGARLCGPVARPEVPALLADLDLLVVPSLWYENAPLVILEARAVGTPVLVSDVGGMAELVTDGLDGRHFRLGDAGDLARVLGELLSPAALAALRGGPPVPSVEADAARMEAVYAEVLREARGR